MGAAREESWRIMEAQWNSAASQIKWPFNPLSPISSYPKNYVPKIINPFLPPQALEPFQLLLRLDIYSNMNK